jgi:hypothetical protein
MTELNNMFDLKTWLHQDRQPKLFLFDEVNVHLPARRSMSKKSVSLIQIFPEISKARARMLVIGQETSGVDKTLKNTTWVRGLFRKVNLRTALMFSPLAKRPLRIGGIPQTHIPFDPYMIAPFTDKPQLDTLEIQNEDIKLLLEVAKENLTWKHWGHPQTYKRWLNRTLLDLITNYVHRSHISGGVNVKQQETISDADFYKFD